MQPMNRRDFSGWQILGFAHNVEAVHTILMTIGHDRIIGPAFPVIVATISPRVISGGFVSGGECHCALRLRLHRLI
ncbi:MAG: hypothetical protein ALAOOOJD_02145 [bacterium]|nr:hypothetical protein [bacterium]